MEVEQLRREIGELIGKRAYQKRRVTLASGRESNFYIDSKQVTLTAEGIYRIALYILKLVRKENMDDVEAVGGPVMGAVPLAAAVSALSRADGGGKPLDIFFVRPEAKGHGTKSLVEGPTLREGAGLLLLDDVLTTGGSVLKAVHAVREMGCRVEKVLVIVDRQEGGRENLQKEGLQVYSILTREEIEEAAGTS